MAQAQAKQATAGKTAAEDVSDQIAALKADIAKLTSSVADLGREKSADFQAYAKGKAGEARLRAQEGADYMKTQADAAYGKAQEFVSEKPATAIGIAAALGFLIGHISARK